MAKLSFKIKDSSDWSFTEKMIFTLVMLFVYRVGVMIPLPFVNPEAFEQALSQGAASGLITAMTMVGGSLSQLGILSLGVMPYITASIIFQLLKVAIPRLKEMSENAIEQKKITQWTRYLTVFLALLQGAGIVLAAPQLLGFNVFTNNSFLAKALAIFIMTVGALITMRIGEEITARGVSNGMSLVIFTSILASMPGLVHEASVAKHLVGVVGFLAILFGVLAVVSFVERSEYNVPVVYAKSSFRSVVNHNKLPIKVAIAGVLPVIFASAFISVPGVASEFFKASWLQTFASWLTPDSWLYTVLFIVLVTGMTYFSVQLVFDAKMIAKQINEQGGFVAGKRPGKETYNFINYISYKMAGLDAVYLVCIGLVSLFLFPLVGVPEGAFGATSIIILCTVVVTLLKVIDTEITSKKFTQTSLFNR